MFVKCCSVTCLALALGWPMLIMAADKPDDDAKAHLAVIIIDLTHYPNARSIHLDDDIGTLGRGES